MLGDLDTGVLQMKLSFLGLSLEISLEKEARRNFLRNLGDFAALRVCWSSTSRWFRVFRRALSEGPNSVASLASSTEDTEELSSGEARPGTPSSHGRWWCCPSWWWWRWWEGTEKAS